MGTVEEFIDRYRREIDFYQEVARLVAQQAEGLLQSAGIRAIVTFRAKRIDSLTKKLRARALRKQYETVAEIQQDIVDLAGVRIALYFPEDRSEVEKLIRAQFELANHPKNFPTGEELAYAKRFAGYRATHYRVRLKDANLAAAQGRYAEAVVEIQVASVLMHAWAEVEHDLVYKPSSGKLSEEEYAILDELNGLVLTGEIALERLQRAIQGRVSSPEVTFRNHYDLAAYLYEAARRQIGPEEPEMGRIDVLYGLLREADLTRPSQLEPYISSLKAATEERPLAEQLIDLIVVDEPSLYQRYADLRGDLGEMVAASHALEPSRDDQDAIGRFLTAWIELERVVRAKSGLRGERGPVPFSRIIRTIRLGAHDSAEIQQLQRLRNQVVHGYEVPSPKYLLDAASRVRAIAKRLRRRK